MIRLRPYAPADRAAVKSVFYRAVHEGAAAHYTPQQRAAWAPDAAVDPSKPDILASQFCLVAECDGKITGFLSLMDDGYLDMAFVLPEVMGKGHAALLYDGILDHARSLGLSRLTTHASLLAKPFFARRGWHVLHAEDHRVGTIALRRFAMACVILPEAPASSS